MFKRISNYAIQNARRIVENAGAARMISPEIKTVSLVRIDSGCQKNI